MELRQALYGRRATRAFMRDAVPRVVLEALVDAAIQAPSAVNEQPWHFTIIENEALLDKISDESKKFMLQTSRKLPERLHEHLASPEFHVFYHAPVLVVIAAKAGDWAVENATLAAENLMLAAYGQGLGSCWIGFAQHWLGTEEGREAIALDEGYMPVAPIILGYPSAIALPVARNRPRLRWID